MFACGKEGDTRAVGRPARAAILTTVFTCGKGDGTRLAALDRRQPEARAGFGPVSSVFVHQEGDIATIRRYLRVHRRAETERSPWLERHARRRWLRLSAFALTRTLIAGGEGGGFLWHDGCSRC